MGETIVQSPRAAYALVMGSREREGSFVDGFGESEVASKVLIRLDAGEAPMAGGCNGGAQRAPLPR